MCLFITDFSPYCQFNFRIISIIGFAKYKDKIFFDISLNLENTLRRSKEKK